jgi:hypothetical protein
MLRYLAIVVVVVNAIILLAHNDAHQRLGVMLNWWQQAFVYSVIVPGPIIAVLLLPKRPLCGYALLLVTMVGSLVFGVYHHFVSVSPDHVAHLPPGDAQPLFRVTAAAMVVVEAIGAAIAAIALARLPVR